MQAKPEDVGLSSERLARVNAWAQRWVDDGLTGAALYQYAEETAQRLGWLLNLDLTGHRLSEFPHSAHYGGTLQTVDFRPSDLRWVLEIQIRHPERQFGAFFEDLLLEDDRLRCRRARRNPGHRRPAGCWHAPRRGHGQGRGLTCLRRRPQ